MLSPAPAIGPRLYPAFSLVRPTFSEAKSWYDSFQASARMRPWHGLNFLASYTLEPRHRSRLGPEHRRRVAADAAGDDWRRGVDRARRSRARRAMRSSTRVTASSSASATSCRGSTIDGARCVRYILGGWQVNGIVQGQTGFPLTVTEPVDVALHVADQPAEPDVRSERRRAAHAGAVVQHELLPAADAGGKRRPGRRRGPRHGARPGLRAHRPVAVQELRLRGQPAASSCGSRRSTCSTRPASASPAATHRRAHDLRRRSPAADDGRIVQLGIKYQF